MNDQKVRSGGHARIRRHREGQGRVVSTLRAAGDASITAEESGKRSGQVSREEAQYPAATPQGWLNGSTFGVFPDALRLCDSWIWREIVLECMDEMQNLFAVWRQHVVQVEVDVVAYVPGRLGA